MKQIGFINRLGHIAGQQAADDEKRKLQDMTIKNQTQTTVFRGREQEYLANQRQNAQTQAAALLEANRSTDAANKLMVSKQDTAMELAPDKVPSVQGGANIGEVPVTEAVQPHLQIMFNKPYNPSGYKGYEKPASTFITSDESKAAIPNIAAMIYRANAKDGMTVEQAADATRLLISSAGRQLFDRDGPREGDDPKKSMFMTHNHPPGNPEDRRVTIKLMDDRGVWRSINMPEKTYTEASGVRAEFGVNAETAKADDIRDKTLNDQKGSFGNAVGATFNRMATPTPATGAMPPRTPTTKTTLPYIFRPTRPDFQPQPKTGIPARQ